MQLSTAGRSVEENRGQAGFPAQPTQAEPIGLERVGQTLVEATLTVEKLRKDPPVRWHERRKGWG